MVLKKLYSYVQIFKWTILQWLWLYGAKRLGFRRAKHKALLEVLGLLDDVSRIQLLPRSLATLKHNLKSSLPLTKIRKKQLPLTAEKLSSMTPAKKKKHHFLRSPSIGWLSWFDPGLSGPKWLHYFNMDGIASVKD